MAVNCNDVTKCRDVSGYNMVVVSLQDLNIAPNVVCGFIYRANCTTSGNADSMRHRK